jgi:hypothetical protein
MDDMPVMACCQGSVSGAPILVPDFEGIEHNRDAGLAVLHSPVGEQCQAAVNTVWDDG